MPAQTGPGRAGPGTQTSKAPGCASQSKAGWSTEGLDELVPQSQGAQPPSPTPGQGHLPVGPAQRPSPWEVPPRGAELPRGVPTCLTASPRSIRGSSSGCFRAQLGTRCLPQRCPMCLDVSTPSPDPRHTHRHPQGQAARQTAAPEGLGPLPAAPHLRTGREGAGALARRVAYLTAQSRAVTCDPDTLPRAQRAGQRLPPGEWAPGREGPPGGAAGGLGATFPATQSPTGRGRKLIQPFYPPGDPGRQLPTGSTPGQERTGGGPQGWQNPAGKTTPS